MHTEPSKHASHPEIQYEKTDATVRPLYQFLFWISVITAITALISFGILRVLESWREKASVRPTLAQTQAEQQPPGPRLQLREPIDLAKFRAEETLVLSTYGVVDRDSGIYRIPIEEAMRLTVERGLPVAGVPPAPTPAATEPGKARQ